MVYKVFMEVMIGSNLGKDALENQLAICLYDNETNISKLDGTDENLEVLDYNKTCVSLICPECGSGEMEPRMVDTDGTNLVEMLECSECLHHEPLTI